MEKFWLPWLGEFGTELLFWTPVVNADNNSESIKCIERGKHPVYRGSNFVEINPIPENVRGSNGSKIQQDIFTRLKRRFGTGFEYVEPKRNTRFPRIWYEPKIPSKRYNEKYDIVIFPRWRHIAARKNYPHWPQIVDRLTAEGFIVFAAGIADCSYRLNIPAAWDFREPLEATIYAIKNSIERIGLITALHVLSLLCGVVSTVMVKTDGQAAMYGTEGPNYQYLKWVDHKGVGWKTIKGMEAPETIVRQVVETVSRS
jgi:hypothetical protein